MISYIIFQAKQLEKHINNFNFRVKSPTIAFIEDNI